MDIVFTVEGGQYDLVSMKSIFFMIGVSRLNVFRIMNSGFIMANSAGMLLCQ